jgi:hypothetical protein
LLGKRASIGAQIAGAAMDEGRLRAAERVSAEHVRVKSIWEPTLSSSAFTVISAESVGSGMVSGAASNTPVTAGLLTSLR